VSITDGKVHESKIAKSINLAKSQLLLKITLTLTIAGFASFKKKGIYFVTRQKTNATYKITARRQVCPCPWISSKT
jgi:hypothetical protein